MILLTPFYIISVWSLRKTQFSVILKAPMQHTWHDLCLQYSSEYNSLLCILCHNQLKTRFTIKLSSLEASSQGRHTDFSLFMGLVLKRVCVSSLSLFLFICLFVCLFVCLSYKCPCSAHAGYLETDRSLLTGLTALLLRQIARDLLHALSRI